MGSADGLEKNLAFHLSGHTLHSIYWRNLTGDGGGEPLAADGAGEPADAITEPFGSFAAFKAQPTKASATTQGSGWGVPAYEPPSGRLIVEQVYDHQGNAGQGSPPILVFDAWEHAFHLQRRNQKDDLSTPCGPSSTGRTWPGATRRANPARMCCRPPPEAVIEMSCS